MLMLFRGDRFDANFYYKTGVDIDNCFYVENGKKKMLLTSGMNYRLARKEFRGKVMVYRDAMENLAKILRRRSVLVDSANLSARLFLRLKKICKPKDYSVELLKERARKKPIEVSNIRKAVKLTKEIIDSLDIKGAKTEQDLERQLIRMTIEKGLEPAFDPIVSSGVATSFPHYKAGRKKLGPIILVDYGVRYAHYCSDLTRCFVIGDSEKKKRYESLQAILHELVDSLPDMEQGKEVAQKSDELIKKAGLPKMIHSIGHGVGLDIHEFPRLGLKSDDELARSVIAIEPAFYLKNYGMRYEETVWFDGKRARIL